MERVKHPSKPPFVFAWGVLLWGCSTALAITLFDWYTTHHIETTYKVVGRFVIFIVLGIFFGLSLWNRLVELSNTQPTRAGSRLRLVLFVGLVIGLACLLWVTTRH